MSVISPAEFRELLCIRGAVLGVFLTNHCNFRCGHCCTQSGPSEKGAFEVEALRGTIESTDWHITKAIHVSGGEPFLYPEQLQLLAQIAYHRAIPLGVNTNGYWARSPVLRQKLQSSLKGITNLFISYSKWHADYLSRRELAGAIQYATDLAIAVELVVVYEQKTEVEQLVAEIFPEGVPENISVTSGPVEPSGRGATIACPIIKRGAFEKCSLVCRPTVMNDGAFLMCCNTVNYSEGSRALSLGDVSDRTLAALLRDHRDNALVSALADYGPELLLRIGRAIRPGKMVSVGADKCAYCKELLADAHLAQLVLDQVASFEADPQHGNCAD